MIQTSVYRSKGVIEFKIIPIFSQQQCFIDNFMPFLFEKWHVKLILDR